MKLPAVVENAAKEAVKHIGMGWRIVDVDEVYDEESDAYRVKFKRYASPVVVLVSRHLIQHHEDLQDYLVHHFVGVMRQHRNEDVPWDIVSALRQAIKHGRETPK